VVATARPPNPHILARAWRYNPALSAPISADVCVSGCARPGVRARRLGLAWNPSWALLSHDTILELSNRSPSVQPFIIESSAILSLLVRRIFSLLQAASRWFRCLVVL